MNKREQKDSILDRFLSTKFLVTMTCIAGVFVMKFRGIPVDDLSIVLPGILAFYMGGNVFQSAVDKSEYRPRRVRDLRWGE